MKNLRQFLSIGFYIVGALFYCVADFISGTKTTMTFKK